jgi:hypothetical protein
MPVPSNRLENVRFERQRARELVEVEVEDLVQLVEFEPN